MSARGESAIEGLDPRRIQVVCWSILLVAFTIFVALAIGGPWAGWRWAHLATRRANAEVRVTAGGLDRCLGSDCLPSLREDESWQAPESATLELAGGGNAAAFLRFVDGSTAQIERFGRLRLTRLRRPLFPFGIRRPTIALTLEPVSAGTALLRAGARFYDGPPDRAPDYHIDTPHGRVSLAPETHVQLRLDDDVLRVAVAMGQASVTANAETNDAPPAPSAATRMVVVRRGERTVVRRGAWPSAATDRPENVLPDSDFDRPPVEDEGWVASPVVADTAAPPQLTHVLTPGGRTAMRFAREGSNKSPADLVLARDFEAFDLTDATWLSVAATVRIDRQSLPGGGDRAEEFPLIVTLVVGDAAGNEQRWFTGFYSLAPDPSGSEFAGARVIEGRDVQVTPREWTAFDSGNLLDAANRRGFAGWSAAPVRLKRLEIKASGHDFEAWVDQIEVLWK
ncbi:MAG: hypothetical protein IT332_12730 [Ardenticatenales bacterium]|nr:hypothetical protein [Ardenticatenales bacterium]